MSPDSNLHPVSDGVSYAFEYLRSVLDLRWKYSAYRQLSRNARGKDPGRVASMNKLVSTNIGCEIAEIAIDLLGDQGLCDPETQARGMAATFGSARSWMSQYMYSLGIAIAGGTANIQRNVIGERALGLPRDYYAQRSSGK